MDYGWMLVRMFLVLGAICALAWVLLRWCFKRLAPTQVDQQGSLEVVDRLGVGSGRVILVVRAGEEYLLVGSSEAGLERLGRLDAEGFGDGTDGDPVRDGDGRGEGAPLLK